MDIISGEIKKRDNCIIRIGSTELAGQHFVELRQFYKDKYGDFQPSRKAITFKSDLLDEVIKSLETLKRDIARNG